MAPKNTLLRAIFSSCCLESKSARLDQKNDASKQYSFRGITVSDSSNPGIGSPISSEISNSLIGSNLHAFSLMELEAITQHFSPSNFLGEGGFGPVHKGFIDDKMKKGLEAQPVAVKLLDLEGNQGHREWLAEVIFLGQLRHPHLVKLIGYCCEDEHRLLVYEYIARGNLDNQLFRRYSIPLRWLTRIKIAVGAAKGLAFLHGEEMPVIYRDLKASNILLDSDYTAKLSDFGLARDGPQGDRTHVTTRVMGTHGYAAPEYIMTGHLTTKSDVYSFGVVLVELLTGRRAMDKSRPNREQCLVEWARPQLKDPQKLERFMDPRLEGQYSTAGAKKAAALAYGCLSHNPQSRPTMSHVVNTLEPLMDLDYDIPVASFVYSVPSQNDVPEERNDEEQKEEEHNENGPKKCPKGTRHRRRLRSRAVYSDTALYKTLRKGLNSPNQHKDGN